MLRMVTRRSELSAQLELFFYLVGCTLFSDKSGIRVSVLYVSLFENLGVVSTYA